MRAQGRLGFTVSNRSLQNDVLIPKYYDPEIEKELGLLATTHELVPVADLLKHGHLEMRQGNYIGKMHYGTGGTPYIRTSDIANWELRGSPKHGVSEAVKEEFRKKQNVKEGDVLLVHEGTYLIGTSCLLTKYDTDILYQHHVARLRVLREDILTGPLLMVALLAPIVQRQIRSKQFTADVIDSIVGRFREIVLPLPREKRRRLELSDKALAIFTRRAECRARLAALRRCLDGFLLEGRGPEELELATSAAVTADGASSFVSFLGTRYATEAFTWRSKELIRNILLPRYYDPKAPATLEQMKAHCHLVSIGELVARGALSLQTGDEVGKLAYGGGDIPFVRTSDLGNWELKFDPKHRVSDLVWDAYSRKQSVEPEDILLVRDGTYLVGTSSMVSRADVPMLFSGGIYRIRVTDRSVIDPYLLLALLNTDVAARQMRNKQFTRDVIDTLGKRFEEVVLPVPKDDQLRRRAAQLMRELITERAELRGQIAGLGAELLSV